MLGVIELQDQQGNTDTLSPRLRSAAMEAVAVEAGRRKLHDALPPQRHRHWALVALGLGSLAVATFIWTPRAGWNALERWLMPFSKTQRYTFTRLENPPRQISVPFGEVFEIKLKLSSDSQQRPAEASARYGLQRMVHSKLSGDDYRFELPGQQDPGTVVFRIGDLRHEIRVEPVQRPSVESVDAVVTPPTYLGIPERTVNLGNGVLSAVDGSRFRIRLTASRELASGEYGPAHLQPGEETLAEHETIPTMAGALEISGRSAATPEISGGSVPFEISFEWRDRLGLSGESGFRLRVDALRDAPPTCYLQGIDRQKVMLPEETVDFEVLSEDDFGVKKFGIEWLGQLTRPTGEPPAAGEIKLGEGSPDEARLMKAASFSPAAFGITPQKVVLRGYSEDRFPERGRVYSEPVVIYVLTRDEHAQMLKNKFDRIITEFEDLARREQDLLDENQRLERLDGADLQKEENANRLQNQQEAEAESERRMKELTERMESLMKDAARNNDIEKETLKKIAESLKSMQELSEQDLPKVEDKLSDSAEPSNTPEKSEKDVTEAVEAQKKALEKMRNAIQNANDANQKFEADTFINRLKKAATEQNGIAAALIESYERMLGMRNSKLDPSDQRRLSETTLQQTNIASDVRWLQEDLSHYFARTQTEYFKQILDEMRSSQIDIGLEEIRSLLSKNKTYTATEDSKRWADQLTAWATKLEAEKGGKSGGGGGGGGGEQSPEDEDFEFMLRVMKLIQQEQDIRSQTRALEQLRREIPVTEEPLTPSEP